MLDDTQEGGQSVFLQIANSETVSSNRATRIIGAASSDSGPAKSVKRSVNLNELYSHR